MSNTTLYVLLPDGVWQQNGILQRAQTFKVRILWGVTGFLQSVAAAFGVAGL